MPDVETQPKVSDRQLDREKAVDERFEKIEEQLSLQPTKAELEVMLSGVAKQEDIAKLNGYVHNFLLGVQILEKSSKWVLYAVITIGGIAGGIIVIKQGLVGILAWAGFTQLPK